MTDYFDDFTQELRELRALSAMPEVQDKLRELEISLVSDVLRTAMIPGFPCRDQVLEIVLHGSIESQPSSMPLSMRTDFEEPEEGVDVLLKLASDLHDQFHAAAQMGWKYRDDPRAHERHLLGPAEELLEALGKRLVAAEFSRLKRAWVKDTMFASSASVLFENDHYKAIIALGWPVVPYLIREMREEPHHWSSALRAITRENPVPKDAAGKLGEMARAWVEWADAREIERV